MISRGSSILRHSLAIIVALLVALAAGGSQPAQAANIVVNTTDDELNSDSDCSLREAITAANTDAAVDACTAGSGPDTITLPAGTYTLSIVGTNEDSAADGDLDVTDDLTINGAGAATTIIDGNGAVTGERVFHVDPASAGITVDISGVTIRGGDDSSGFGGAGALSRGGTLTLTNSVLSGNTTTQLGGALKGIGPAVLTLDGVTVSGNTAGNGTIYSAGFLTITNSTISGNTVNANGGGIYNSGTAMLTNVTVSGNTAAVGGGGIRNEATLTLTNTIIANSVSGGDCDGSTITSNGHNLDSDGTCGLSGTGDLPNTDPKLGSLADNGGPTETLALLSGSPAIDAGDDAACPATDQRGVARPIDGDVDGAAVCDIGAYEAPAGTTVPTPTPAPSPSPTPDDLPPTGGNPGSGGGVLTPTIVLLAAGLLALAGIGSALAARRHRR